MKGMTTLTLLAAAGAGYVVWQQRGRRVGAELRDADRAVLGAARLWCAAQVEAADLMLHDPAEGNRATRIHARHARVLYADFERRLAVRAGDITVPDGDELRQALESAGLGDLKASSSDIAGCYQAQTLRSHQLGLVWLNERLLPLVWNAEARKLLQRLRSQVIQQLDQALQLTRNADAPLHASGQPAQREADLDDALADTFPASDPVSPFVAAKAPA